MAKIPGFDNTIADIMAQYDAEEVIDVKPRPYLGMSSIGKKCMRAPWYGFHWAHPKKTSRRGKRIFERGDIEEARIIRDLKAIGVECFIRDGNGNKIEITGAIGEKQEELIGFARHAKGHIDGRCAKVPDAPKAEHLAEFKTANDKNFKEFKVKGVEEMSPAYYGQLQRYMHATQKTDHPLNRALFCVTNKNDESRHWERVPYRKDYALELIKKEQYIIMSEEPLAKIGGATWYECKWCDAYDVCQKGAPPQQNCRTCDHSDIENDGKWSCSYEEKELSYKDQLVGCKMWTKGWGL